MTDNTIINTLSIFQSKFISESLLLHQLVLPIATISDTGNYSCVVQTFIPNDNTIISQTISLTVIPGM